MSYIHSIGTAVPQFMHRQNDILRFMQMVYAPDEVGKRKLRFLYRQSGIDTRYSVIPDYSNAAGEWTFYPATENLEPFPSLEQRMKWYYRHAGELSVKAIRNCMGDNSVVPTHLITVSCTGMSAPGLDLQIMELMGLPNNTYRSSVNFMGCYAAIHALKMADAICKSTNNARVMIVSTELCTLHFQKESTPDNIASSLLFGDGSAAVLVCSQPKDHCLKLESFYAEVLPAGRDDMSWQLSSSGFLMTLSGYVPELIGADIAPLVERSLAGSNANITHWCIHPGGRRILETIGSALKLEPSQLKEAYDVLREFGNLSSATLLFVLKRILDSVKDDEEARIYAAAFGPGLTMETFTATRNISSN